MNRHLHVTGARAADRRQLLEGGGDPKLVVNCHQGLRGSYTGIDTILGELIPQIYQRFPELVDDHRMELLETVPELSRVIGPPLRSLAAVGPFQERTRFYSRGMVRCFSQGIVTMLRDYAQRLRLEGQGVPTLVFDAADAADSVGQSFLALFVRRIDPALWPAVIGSTGAVAPDLARALAEHADLVEAAAAPAIELSAADWAVLYVSSDGTTDQPAALASYQQLPAERRRELHDARAAELAADASWGTKVAALPFHAERGSDPAGAGVDALLQAAEYCTGIGLSALVVQLCERGRALADPEGDFVKYRKLSHLMVAALISTSRLTEALELCHELRRRFAAPLVHMTTSYLIAMVHTRFLRPRDHETAAEWQNNAIVIASNLPDERERLVLTGFQENGMALVEMHRGNLDRALELVETAMARLDAELAPHEWALHRSQLLYNRTRLFAAMKRSDEAYDDFSTLIELDPHYTDYLSERAKLARKRGDLESAIADYNRAVKLGAPFPELFHNRGSAFVELGQLELALADFDFVLDMEPEDTETLLSRAELLFGIGENEAALRDVQLALELQPSDARMRCLRGLIQLAGGAPEAARQDFTEALATDAGYPAALVNRAVAYYELGQPELAAADLTSALELLGEDPDLLLNRALAHAAAGDAGSAVADLERARQLPDADLAEIDAQLAACSAPVAS